MGMPSPAGSVHVSSMSAALCARAHRALSIVFEHYLAPACTGGWPWVPSAALGPTSPPWPVPMSKLSVQDPWHQPSATGANLRAFTSLSASPSQAEHAAGSLSFSENEMAVLRRVHLPKLRGRIKAGHLMKAGYLADQIFARIAPLAPHHQQSLLVELCHTAVSMYPSEALPTQLVSHLLTSIQAGRLEDDSCAAHLVHCIMKRLGEPSIEGLSTRVVSVLPRVAHGLSPSQAVTCMRALVRHGCYEAHVFEALAARLSEPSCWQYLALPQLLDVATACAQSGHMPQPMWQHLVQAVFSHIHDMTHQQLSDMYSVLSQFPAAHEPQLLSALQHAATRALPDAQPHVVSSIAWSLSSLETKEARSLLPHVLHAVSSCAHSMTLEQLATVLYSATKHMWRDKGMLVHTICTRVTSSETSHVQELSTCRPGVLVRLYWSLGKLGDQDSTTLDVLAAYLTQHARARALTAREVGMLLDACWYLQHREAALINALLDCVAQIEIVPPYTAPRVDQLDVVSATKILRSLGNLQHENTAFVDSCIRGVLRVLDPARHPCVPTRLSHLVDAAALLHPVLQPDTWQQLLQMLERAAAGTAAGLWGSREVAIAIKGMSWLWIHEEAWIPSQHLVLRALLDVAQHHLGRMKAKHVIEVVQALVRMRYVPPASIQKDLLQCLLGKVLDDKYVGVPEVAELLCSWGMHLSGPQGQDLSVVLQSCMHVMPLEMLVRLARCCLHTPWPNAGHRGLLEMVMKRCLHLVSRSATSEQAASDLDMDVQGVQGSGDGEPGLTGGLPRRLEPPGVLVDLLVVADECVGTVPSAELLCRKLLQLLGSMQASGPDALGLQQRLTMMSSLLDMRVLGAARPVASQQGSLPS